MPESLPRFRDPVCAAELPIIFSQTFPAPVDAIANMPSQADEIRAYALERYVRPWRDSDGTRLAIRAGDVVRGMGLHNATPNVCSSLAGRKFLEDAKIVLVRREGPLKSTTTTFYYESAPGTLDAPARPPKNSKPRPELRLPRSHFPPSASGERWRSADLCLVSCVSAKQSAPAKAKDLYISARFRKARACIEALGCPWYIFSAKQGLLDPGSMVDPYDETLNAMPVDRRRIWAHGVIAELARRLSGVNSVTMFAGMAYREHFEAELRGAGARAPCGRCRACVSASSSRRCPPRAVRERRKPGTRPRCRHPALLRTSLTRLGA